MLSCLEFAGNNNCIEETNKIEDNFKYSNHYEDVKHKLEKHMFLPHRVNPKKSEPELRRIINKFGAHPRNCSGSDTSVSVSPRQNRSNIHLELEIFERNKERIKNARRKLHEKLTNTYSSEEQLFDVNIGDSYDVTPVNSFIFDRHLEYSKKTIKENSEIREPYECKRKPSIHTPKNNKVDRQEEKIASKLTTNPLAKILAESVFEKKFKAFVEKSLQILNEIRNLLDKGIEPPDGDEDVSRRKLRVKEFSNRFSRNYLYPIIRQIDDLSRYKQPHNSCNQKLLSAYHVIYNGLIAYQNHLPSSIGSCSFDKLKLLLKHLMDLCDIHYKLIPTGDKNGYYDFIEGYKHNAEVTLQKVEDHFIHYSQVVTSLQLNRTENKVPKTIKKIKNTLEDRLYMYSTTMTPKKDSLLKKAPDTGKKKIAIKSRYKTAQFKHRPPIQPSKHEITINNGQSTYKLLSKKSSTERSAIPNPINEDNISTMVQMDIANDKNNHRNDEVKPEIGKVIKVPFK